MRIRPATTPGGRARQVADAAIAVLADHGARGLPHRAVDQAAGLPPGTTSNYARTREALLTLTLTRIAELDAADGADGLAGPEVGRRDGSDADGAGLADALARMLHRMITDTGARQRLLARFRPPVAATRRPEPR